MQLALRNDTQVALYGFYAIKADRKVPDHFLKWPVTSLAKDLNQGTSPLRTLHLLSRPKDGRERYLGNRVLPLDKSLKNHVMGGFGNPKNLITIK